MKKEDFLKQKGMKIRKVTPSDKKVAKTDYQRKANYIIKTKSGKEYFSSSGTLKDCIAIDKLNQMQKKEKKQNVQKTTGNRVKTTTTRKTATTKRRTKK